MLNKIDKLPMLFDALIDLQEELKKYSNICGANIVYSTPNELIIYVTLNKKEFEKVLKAKSNKINGFDIIQRDKYTWKNMTEGIRISENCKESVPTEIEEIADKLETIEAVVQEDPSIILIPSTTFLL